MVAKVAFDGLLDDALAVVLLAAAGDHAELAAALLLAHLDLVDHHTHRVLFSESVLKRIIAKLLTELKTNQIDTVATELDTDPVGLITTLLSLLPILAGLNLYFRRTE